MSNPDRTGAEITMPTVSPIAIGGVELASSEWIGWFRRASGTHPWGWRRQYRLSPIGRAPTRRSVSAPRLRCCYRTCEAREILVCSPGASGQDPRRFSTAAAQDPIREARERSSDMNEVAPTVPRREESGGIEGAVYGQVIVSEDGRRNVSVIPQPHEALLTASPPSARSIIRSLRR